METKKLWLLVVSILLGSNLGLSQNNKPELVCAMVKKGTVAVSGMLGINGQAQTPGNLISTDFVLSPKMTFFVLNRIGIGFGYLGTYSSSNIGVVRRNYSNNAEIELICAAVAKSRYYMGIQAGCTFGENRVVIDKVMPPVTAKAGVSCNWQFKEFPKLSFNLNPVVYIGHRSIASPSTQVYGNISFGLCYSVFAKPKTATE